MTLDGDRHLFVGHLIGVPGADGAHVAIGQAGRDERRLSERLGLHVDELYCPFEPLARVELAVGGIGLDPAPVESLSCGVPMADLHLWLDGFGLDASLRTHVLNVFTTLPDDVRIDLTDDPAFHMSDYEPVPGRAFLECVGIPRARSASRSVVLKRTLRHRPPEFVRWVIAHELAHAHLRNAGRFPGEDPERAADALAGAVGTPQAQRFSLVVL